MRSLRSKTVTQWPALLSWAAQARPAGPEPTTATRLPVRVSGGSGTTQPSSKPLSMMAHSMFLIVTGGALMPSTHAPSHGAGQTRPVNSGKLLVLCSRSSASRHRPRYTRSFHSGIRLLTGQPDAMPLRMRAGVAERDAAVHAARALLAQLGLVQVQVELVPVPDALGRRPVQGQFAQILNKSRGFPHVFSLMLKA